MYQKRKQKQEQERLRRHPPPPPPPSPIQHQEIIQPQQIHQQNQQQISEIIPINTKSSSMLETMKSSKMPDIEDDAYTVDIGRQHITIDKDLLNQQEQKDETALLKKITTILGDVKDELDKRTLNRSARRIIRRGLLIGINYTNTRFKLNGCINDTENLRNFLVKNRYMNECDMIFMNDNQKNNLYPTKNNILEQFESLVKFSNEHKDEEICLFVSYSGHGTNVRDENGDEADGMDEMICPIDCETVGFISDDYMREYFIDKLGENVTVVMLVDACHSGTIVDLKYTYECDKNDKQNIQGNMKDTRCNIIMISGCKDSQTSADAYMYDKDDKRLEFQGAMTNSFINCYHENITTYELINNMRGWLKKRLHSQIPECSTGKITSTKERFMLSKFKMM
jgi:hypothetical protein